MGTASLRLIWINFITLFAAATVVAAFQPWISFGLICAALVLNLEPDVRRVRVGKIGPHRWLTYLRKHCAPRERRAPGPRRADPYFGCLGSTRKPRAVKILTAPLFPPSKSVEASRRPVASS
jgi:hypothetical protein